ncbi:MAG: hypothetical protein WCK77_07570 [Verrucomicrobiota bacterium]
MKLLAVLIHDEPDLRDLLAGMLEAWTRYEVTVERVGFGARLPGPMKRWIEEAGLFIVGLERYYAQGRCAEGVDTAEMLFKLGKKVLVVGSECKAKDVGVPFYWDIALEKSFLEAARDVLDAPIPGREEREKFAKFFEKRREKPVGHGAKSNSI